MMGILLSRWVMSLLGTVVLAGLLWVFGPLWDKLDPWWVRLLAIQSMLVLWALVNALIDWRRRARDNALAAGLTAAAPGQEIAAVDDTLAKALKLLKKSGQGGSLFAQPWYAIIGPPGAGKTTALMNAGLNFTLAEQLGRAAVAGVGGTRLCEWWFTDQGVLIDTAGRYTTQDSNESVDRAGWAAFLALLKRNRPRQPLNGVIVAIGLSDIIQAGEAERAAHAAAIRQRIAELEASFGLALPVYVLFTKADLIAGFSEFFDNLDREQRDQVWGQTFDLTTSGRPFDETGFIAGFRELVIRLNQRLLPRLQAEHRPDRRGLIAGFPTQVASLEKPLATFLSSAFGKTTSSGAPLLRGVYFASGTQEGTPIDRLTGAMARAFGIDQARAAALRPEQGRSYFLGRLLREVVFGEAMLVSESPAAVRASRLLRHAAMAVVLLAALGTAGFMVWNEQTAAGQVGAVATALATYEQSAQSQTLDPVSDGDLRGVATLLDQAHALTAEMPKGEVGLGMGQAAKLEAAAAIVYRNGLIYGLLPRLVWRLETQIRGTLTRPEPLYELTRIYLMLGGAGPLNAPEVRDWMTADWSLEYPEDDDAPLRTALAQHLDRLLAEPLPPITLDAALVGQARASFSRVPLADRVYAGIKPTQAATALPPWRPVDSLGLAGVQIFTRASGKSMADGIAGFYSDAGYRKVLLPSLAAATKSVAGEAWVLGRTEDFGPAELQTLQDAVTKLYFADFTQRWDAMLADLNIAPVASLPQAAQSLYILASPESPLRALLKSLAAQIKLDPATPPAQHFRALIDLTSGDGAGLERSLRLVADIQQQLAKIAALPIGTALPPGGDDIGNVLNADAARQPQPLKNWLTAISASAQALRTNNVRRQAALAYNAPGGPAQACQAATANHYPFTATGDQLPLEDFARVFGPGALLDGFVNTLLKPYIDTATKPWKVQTGNGPAPVTPADVAQFQRAAAIRDAFFAPALGTIGFQLEITPNPAETRAITLDFAGTAIQTGHGPAHGAQISWPPDDITLANSLSIDPPAAPLPITESGPWAMFRLFAHARLQPIANKPGRATLTFPGPTAPISYELHVTSPTNPFLPNPFADFHCPSVQ